MRKTVLLGALLLGGCATNAPVTTDAGLTTQQGQVVEGVFTPSDVTGGLITDSDPVATREAFFKRPAPVNEAYPWPDLIVDPAPLSGRGYVEASYKTTTDDGTRTDLVVDPDPLASRGW